MNIFVLDENIQKCAEYSVDKHVVKMVLESAQLLSAAVRMSGIDAGYKLTHKNHPCTKWASESLSNWRWLKSLTFHLNNEYRFRYNKNIDHKSFTVAMSLPEPKIKDIGITKFALAMPDEFRSDDAIKSYRDYYINQKSHIANWTKRNKPYWWKD